MKIQTFLTIIFALFIHTQSQQCQYPFQRCLCNSGFPLCKCEYITENASFNFDSDYSSHLVLVSGSGCLPCPSLCQQCSSINNCVTCKTQSYLKQGQCLPCQTNCKYCSEDLCIQCLNGYYLDSKKQCQLCPWQGTLQCTINQLKLCKSDYFMDNNGAQCIRCDVNCKQCSSTTKCKVCYDGYYLNSQYGCDLCHNQCKTCIGSSSNCIQCNQVSHYFSDFECFRCSVGCIQCIDQGCTKCNSEYIRNFTNCLLQEGNIKGCKAYSFDQNTQVICQQCQQGYFLDNEQKICHYGCSIMCKQCKGAHYGLCNSCNQQLYSVYLNHNCLPNYNILSGAAYQLYYTSFNNPTIFQNTYLQQRNDDICLYETISIGDPSISFKIYNPKAYKIQLKMKLYELYENQNEVSSESSINFEFFQIQNTSKVSVDIKQINIESQIQCLNRISKVSISASDIKQNNQLLIYLNNQYGKIGISEILLIGYRCGGLQGKGCLQCQNINMCTKCIDQSYYILNQQCVIECPNNYLTYEIEKKCYQVCPYGTFPYQFQRKCYKCPDQCSGCINDLQCFACSEGFYLYQGTSQCIEQCPQKYYQNPFIHKCQKCVFPCLQCESNRQCSSCLYGFYDQVTHSCTTNCPQTNYADISTKKCQSCQYPCQSCQFRPNYCITCVDNYTFFQNACYQQCPYGFYSSENITQCILCPYQCSSCISENICLTCSIGYYYNGKCMTKCPNGFYNNDLSLQCVRCSSECTLCTNKNICTACNSGFYLIQLQSQCVSQCPQNMYIDGQYCEFCQPPCRTCSSKKYCLTCQESFWYNGDCLGYDQCPTSTFPSQMNMVCQACHQGCLSCKKISSCQQCIDTYHLFNQLCLQQCPIGTFTFGKICIICQKQCTQCKNQTSCISCVQGLVLYFGNCIKQCPSGTYVDVDNHCKNCEGNCLTCASNSQCLSCQQGYILQNNQNYTDCVSTCLSNQYKYLYKCLKCELPCFSCISQIQCTSCSPQYGYYYQGSCLSQCPQGFYIDDSQCKACSYQCINCQQRFDNCNQCKQGFYLNSNYTCVLKNQCSEGFYANQLQNICLPCSSFCKFCSQNLNNCTECIVGYYFYDNKCLQQCPDSYYGENGICNRCSDNCYLCNEYQHCIICFEDYNLIYNDNETICLVQCPQRYYFQDMNICIECIFPCQTCLSKTQCLTCKQGMLYQGQCLKQCPYGSKFSQNSSSCISCGQSCMQCDQQKCLFCQNSVLINGMCQQQCELGTYQSYGVCFNCMYGCSDCNNSYSCNLCTEGFLYDNQCVKYCPFNLIQSNGTCISCKQECKQCQVSADFCTKCYDNQWLYLGSCLSQCLPGTYASSQVNQCFSCNLPCQTCLNAFSCQTCIYGYILYGQGDRKQCVKGQYCPNSYYLDLQANFCKKECDEDQYSEQISKSCSKQCPIGFVKYQEQMLCLLKCPQNKKYKFYVDIDRKCQKKDESFQNLPEFNCQPSIIRSILFIKCTFNYEVANLNILEIKNLELENFQLSNLQTNSNKIFYFIATPRDPNPIFQMWAEIKLNPGYLLYSDLILQNRRLQSQQVYPVQNIKDSFYIKSYFTYSSAQRQTGLHFMELANSFALIALIFWIFSLIKNRKVYSLVAVTGMQWLYTLSLLTTELPPNVKQLLQGFKFSMLIFDLDDSLHIEQLNSQILWKSQNFIRPEISSVNQLTNIITLGLPIISLICFTILVYGILCFIPKITQKCNYPIDHWTNSLNMKFNIIKQRYTFNYIHHFSHLLAAPIGLMFFAQCIIGELFGFIISLALIIGLIVVLFHSFYLSFLTKNSGNRYFLVISLENIILTGLAIFNEITLYTGSSLFIFVLNIILCKYIFFSQGTTWRVLFFSFVQVARILIILSISILQFIATQSTSSENYSRGWLLVILIFVFGFIVQIISARDFFEEDQQIEKKKKQRIESKSEMLKQNILDQEDANKNQYYNRNSSIDMYQQEEQSFFEDQEQVRDSDEELSLQTEVIGHKAPQKLIKFDK